MEVNKGITTEQKRMDDIINEFEGELFVGRKKEIEIFRQHTESSHHDAKVLHIYGTGGIGKTYLLSEYSRIAEQDGILFLMISSEDFHHTPSGFVEYLCSLIEMKISQFQYHTTNMLQNCFQNLADIAREHKIIIAIDTYEKMDDLKRWLRQVFIRNIDANILFIFAGRKKLKGEWKESPAWRRVTKQVELKDFTLEQTNTYLSHYGIKSKRHIKSLWQFTEGHPLTLSLAAITDEKPELDPALQLTESIPQILIELTKRWLQEVENEDLQNLIEAAAILQNFNQMCLSSILNQKISMTKFNELLSLSFIKQTRNGWAMHDLIRDSIRIELKHRNPEHFELLSERSAAFYYHRTVSTRSSYDIAQFFYHLGDEFIQSAFFQDSIDTSLYFEPVASYNFHEVAAFFEHKKNHLTKSDVQFYSRGSNTSYHFHASLRHNKKELELMDKEYIKKMGYNVAQLLKNEHGETLGLSVLVPINKHTLEHLSKEPVSRAYFSRLTGTDKKSFSVSDGSNAGWFIRMLDYANPSDTAARSFSLYNLFPLLLSGGKIIVSTPLPFFQDLLKNFGFQEIPNALHYDYGEDYPSPTYLLDVSGAKLAVYLKQFTAKASESNQIEIITKTFSFTEREVDIVRLILDGRSNAAIANQLFVAEVTVKKHISRILAKARVKNRTQLIKRIMDII
ncbi:LuxR C-terminal-related transcriptional regulator [Virgibacillus indicus]|uniref:LuxR C-terminal-related transcriptional regulator n=1 Tax=Virgibacillus indicus TaxID=2024554 RepID=UPI0013FDA00D|nr:LuxR C-terminal-related transcriptional regulator [Virgibacillus indicus]